MGGTGCLPKESDVVEAKAKVGMHLVELCRDDFTVRFAREGVMLDLGAVGKGYAIERAAELLRESGVRSGLLHGGTSTVYGIGHPPEEEYWEVALPNPSDPVDESVQTKAGAASPGKVRVLLRDESLSVSAVWGRSFQVAEKTFGHVIDPRTGSPASNAVLAAVVLPSATETDALSTALLTLGPDGHERISSLRAGIRTLIVAKGEEGYFARSKGIEGEFI